jgi:ribosomal protein L24E
MSQCRYCGKEITWMKDGRKNVPVEGDGSVHMCDQYKSAKDSFKKLEKSSLSAEEIAKYESAMNEATKKSKKKS